MQMSICLARGLDRLDDRHDAGFGLDDEFHGVYSGHLVLGFLGPLDRALAVGTSAVSAVDTRSVCITRGVVTM